MYIKYIILHRVFSQGEFWQSLLLGLLVVFQNNSTYLPEHIKNESPECDILRSPKIHTQPSQILCPNEKVTSKLSSKLRSSNIEHEIWNGMQDRSAKDIPERLSVTDFEHYPR